MLPLSTIVKFLIFTGFAAWIAACGGSSGGSGGSDKDVILTGQFIDSPVSGVSYVAGKLSGITNAGRYRYRSGNTLLLSIGDIVLGGSIARRIFTPLTLVSATNPSDDAVVNIASLLQTLDDDGDPSNGILITEAVRTAAGGKTIDFAQSTADFANDGNVQTVVAELTALTTAGARSLVGAADAESHLRSTLEDLLLAGMGTYNGKSVNKVFNCTDPDFNRTNRSTGSITINSVVLTTNGATFSGFGSFSLTEQGVTVREDFSFSGASTMDYSGNLSGSIVARAYVNGVFQGSDTSAYTGLLDGSSLTIVTPDRFNQNFGFVTCDVSGSRLTLSK